MANLEEDVLKPKDPSLRNSDEWPTFNLKKITVVSQKTGELCSLLAAHKSHPVTVSGKLEKVDRDLLPLVKDKRYRDKPIELRDVTTYAFAEYEDGSYGFWAAGKAGWFEIQSPASSFKETYTLMNEAASMFYMLADKLRRAIKKRPKLNVKELDKYTRILFKEYLTSGKSLRLFDVDAVREAFHEHRGFLITSMLECQEGLDWAQTPMLNYYESKFSDEYSKIEARVFGTTNALTSASSEKRDSSNKRKSQSPHAEGPKDKKTRKGKVAAEVVENHATETPQSKQVLDALSSDEDGVPNVLTRKRKSILQPSGGKTARKAAGRRKSLLDLGGSMRSSRRAEVNEEDSQFSEGFPITMIRTAGELELTTNPPREGSPDGPRYLPQKYLELRVVEYGLPSPEPQGPGDLWSCSFEGCFCRVHQASTPDGKARIMEHFKTHATQAQEKIDLALNESRPYLPVNNLVRRLQAFAPDPGTELALNSLQRKWQPPIRRKY